MFSKWLKKGGARGWTAVDLSADGVLGVSVRPSTSSGGKLQVVKCGMVEGAALGSDALTKLANKISVPRSPWALSLERAAYNMLVIQEPPVLPAEMEQSIRWTLGPMIDFPVDEANISWMSIPTLEFQPHRPPNIYVVVARRLSVQHHADMFRQAGLTLDAVDVRETAQRNIANCVEKAGEAVALVSMGRDGVMITFSFKGELYLDRFIEQPLDEVVSGDEDARLKILDRITLQVQRSIDLINRTLSFMPVQRVLLAPMPAEMGVREHLAQNLSVPVEVLDLADVFDFSLTPELKSAEQQSRYLVALGMALRGMWGAS